MTEGFELPVGARPKRRIPEGKPVPGRKRALADKLRNHYAMHMKMRRQENPNAKPGRYTRPKGEVITPGPSATVLRRKGEQ